MIEMSSGYHGIIEEKELPHKPGGDVSELSYMIGKGWFFFKGVGRFFQQKKIASDTDSALPVGKHMKEGDRGTSHFQWTNVSDLTPYTSSNRMWCQENPQ